MRHHDRALGLLGTVAAAALTLVACGDDQTVEEASSSTEVAVASDERSDASEETSVGETADGGRAAEGADDDTAGEDDRVAAEESGEAADDEQTAGGDDGDDAADIALRAVFVEYRQALIERNGAAAAALVSSNTIEWYDSLLELGLQADAEALETGVPLADAMSVVPMRAQFGDELTTFADGRELFVEGVNEGLTGDDLASVEIEAFTDAGDGTATGTVRGQPLFSFAQDDGGAWTIDLETTTSAIFSQLPEEQFVEGLTGGQATTRRGLFELVARQVYATTWDQLSQPIS